MMQQLDENRICSSIGKALEKFYKGYEWWVECRIDTGLAAVRNLDLNGDYGFYLPLKQYLTSSDPDKIVMRAAGEILERYRIDRLPILNRDKVDSLERDIKGHATGQLD